MSYYTANQTLYWDGSHLTASYTGLRALNPGDVVPDGEVTRDSLDTAGLVTLQTGGLPTRSGADVLEVWQSNRAYLQGQEILDPTGVTILVRKTSGTSRTTYDATEQALWSAAGTTTSGGSSLTPTAVKTANYTAAASDFVPVDTTSGNVTVTLPTAPADKTQIGVKHVVRGGTNTVTIAAGGTDKFNVAGGSTTASLALLREAATFQYVTATGLWYALSNDLPLSQLDTRYSLAGSVNAQVDMLGVGYGLLNGTPTLPYRMGTKYGPNLWTVAKMSSFSSNAPGSGNVMNTSSLTPSLTANGTNAALRTRVDVSTGLTNTNMRFRLTFDVTTTAVTQSGFVGMMLTVAPLDNSGTACSWWDNWRNVWSSVQTILTVQQGDRTLTGHRFVVEFDGNVLRSQTMHYIELALTTANSISAGTMSISNASLYSVTELSPMARGCWSGDPTSSVPALFLDLPLGRDAGGYYRVNRLWYGLDNALPISPIESDVIYDATLNNSLAARYGGFSNTTTGGYRVGNFHINNSDMVMAVTNGSAAQELRGNTHGGETGRSGTFTTDFQVYADYDDGNGWVGPLTNYDTYAWTAFRFKLVQASKLNRSDQPGTPFANIDRTSYFYPDGTIRQDRTVTWLQNQEIQWLIWHMASFGAGSTYIGRSGRGQNVLASVNFQNLLTPPAISSTSQATTGGTIAGSQTVAVSVTALTADGETVPNPKWATLAIPATTNTNTVTINWTAVAGATGYAVYYGYPGLERKVATVGPSATTYTVSGSELPGQQPPITNTAATGYTSDCADSTADWAAYYDPLSGAVFSQALDRAAFKSGVYHALDIRASLEQQAGAICKSYFKTVYTGSDLPLTIPSGTVMTGTVWRFVYFPRDPNRFEAEQTIRGGAVAQLATVYGS